MTKISSALARRLPLHSQLLDGRTKLPKGKEGIAQAIEKLGYVQIDTIAVINRAHHHTLWTRRPDYSPAMLDELQAKDRRVFEYWGHAASYLPMKDYRYYIPRMRAFPWGDGWIKRMYERHKDVMKDVLERITKEGPLGSADFKAPDGKKRGAWWDWKPAKTALEMLFWKGDLMVTERRNFQRIYDLTERVLPGGVDTTVPDPAEVARFRVKRALCAHGIATQREILDHLHISSKEKVPDALDEMVDSGEVIPMKIKGFEGINYYVLSDVLRNASRLRKRNPRLHLLSPFDNLIIHRPRTERLFGFSYSLECYTPPAKRKFGYFCLPILWGEQFVGRLDPKADRKQKTLVVRNLVFEGGFKHYEGILPALAEKLKALASFNRCEKVLIEQTMPGKVKTHLSRTLRL
ncbi:MAG: winged helix-turn-helix domain-containing protein [Candidatus Stahlbacteria bacterium]|nr:MAG: winged helix-turn-helix domain-containing protein [Candidatus Stahlbacteria bacterium]